MAKAKSKRVTISKDTATVAVFDIEALAHRQEDPDRGNLMVVALFQDGGYEAVLAAEVPPGRPVVSALVRCVSGKLRVGPGEEIPSNDEFFDFGGAFVDCEPGTYRVTVWRDGPVGLGIAIAQDDGEAKNAFDKPLELQQVGA